MKDLTVSLEDKPGELARMGEALGGAGVNIEGMAAMTAEGRGIIHLLVEDAAATRAALEGAGIAVAGEADPLIAEFPADQVDRPGAMGEMARAMAEAGVNVQVVYLATKNRGVMVTSDNAKARAALGM
ncbi:MAG TPA: ACT domain-containing protein [Actinomycetota bacterium]|nr:ACT domain-containing protein [Actinomycetota bacterium]